MNKPIRTTARPIPHALALSWIALAILSRGSLSQEPGADPAPLDAYRHAVRGAHGDAGRGRRLFEDAKRSRCVGCHAIDGRGGRLGPDLMGVGGRLSGEELLEAVLEPSARIHPDYAATVLATTSGRVLQGIVRPVSDSEVEVALSETEAVRLPVAEIEERKASEVSLMPSGLQESLSPGEFADLLAYLGRLAPPKPTTPAEATDPGAIPRASRPVAFVPIHDRSQAFRHPAWMGPLPGHPGTFLVTEVQSGRVWRFADGAKTPFLDLSGEITPGDLTGVQSLAFHPDFARNHRYFVKIHGPRANGQLSISVIERRATDDGLADAGVPSRLILNIPVVTEIHNGGCVAFGPDGFLYLGMGDTGPQDDPRGHGQDLGKLLGKILRIDVDHPDGERPYSIPADNPFVRRAGARPEVWAYGLREPWRFSFDPPTGDLWVGDVGQNRFEEVGIVRAGENHGWNVLEGFQPHSEQYRKAAADYVSPAFAYGHGVGASVTGGYVYRGTKQPALVGRYVFGDYETRRVWALAVDGRKLASIVEIGRCPDRLASFGVDDAGELYAVGYDTGTLFRIDPSSADLTPVEAREVVPTSRRAATSWRYTLGRPADSWADPGFDDSSWTSAPGGFGSPGVPGVSPRTDWRTPDIWLRREFILPPEVDPATLTLSVYHDEDAEISLNGLPAAHLSRFRTSYDDAVPISPRPAPRSAPAATSWPSTATRTAAASLSTSDSSRRRRPRASRTEARPVLSQIRAVPRLGEPLD